MVKLMKAKPEVKTTLLFVLFVFCMMPSRGTLAMVPHMGSLAIVPHMTGKEQTSPAKSLHHMHDT